MALKAYSVLEKDENTGSIYFAEHDIEARKAGANEYADGEIGEVTCHRATWADKYAEARDVPASVAVDHGWHFECHGCSIRIDSDMPREHRGRPISGIVGTMSRAIFCRESCRVKDERQRMRAKKERHKAIRDFMAFMAVRYPGIEFHEGEGRFQKHYANVDCYGRSWNRTSVTIGFKFPGCTRPAHFTADGPMKIGPSMAVIVLGTIDDRPAWDEYMIPILEARKNGQAG